MDTFREIRAEKNDNRVSQAENIGKIICLNNFFGLVNYSHLRVNCQISFEERNHRRIMGILTLQ